LTHKEGQARNQDMRAGSFFLLVIFLSSFLWGCVAQQQDVEALNAQVYHLENRLNALDKRLSALETEVARLNEKFAHLEKTETRLNELAQRQADLADELEKLQAEELRLSGQLEQLLYQQGQDRELFQEFQAQILARLDRLEKALAPKKKLPEPKKEVDEEALYKKALNLFRQKKYEEAQALFEEYLRRYPRGKRAPNATFWIGECLYKRKLYEEAILQYQKVIDEFPKSGKVPAALLKQGLSFLRLGDTEAAAIVFKKLVRLYPRTEQARIARKYLAKLGKK